MAFAQTVIAKNSKIASNKPANHFTMQLRQQTYRVSTGKLMRYSNVYRMQALG